MDIEACRHEPAIGEAPPTPLYFDDRYVLPIHTTDLILHRINNFEQDKYIAFYEIPHLYTVKGEIMSQSISSLAHEFEQPFDSLLGIRAMQRSKSQSWPRKDYVWDLEEVTEESIDTRKGCILHDMKSDTSIASINSDTSRQMNVPEFINMLKSVATKQVHPSNIKIFTFSRELSDNEIKQKWERHGELARNLGTHAHYCMERWFNSLPIDLNYPDVQIGLRFIRENLLPLGAKAHRTEIEIYAEPENIAGSVDLSVILPNGEIMLIDWKRSEKLPKKMKGYSKMKEPLSNLEDCSGCSYTLQLGCYKYVLEKYYGFTVKALVLVSLHPDSYFVTSVPYLEKEVEYIMLKRRLLTSTRKRLEMEGKHTHLHCCKTNQLAINAVKDTEGNIYWDKAAIFHEIQTEPCPEIAKEVQNLLQKEIPLAPYPEGLVPWRTQFPGPKSNLLAYSS
tara:strand:- start:1489 stop:2835 length:1347 start_codon:yes stop_codon:yes gene_type:complete